MSQNFKAIFKGGHVTEKKLYIFVKDMSPKTFTSFTKMLEIPQVKLDLAKPNILTNVVEQQFQILLKFYNSYESTAEAVETIVLALKDIQETKLAKTAEEWRGGPVTEKKLYILVKAMSPNTFYDFAKMLDIPQSDLEQVNGQPGVVEQQFGLLLSFFRGCKSEQEAVDKIVSALEEIEERQLVKLAKTWREGAASGSSRVTKPVEETPQDSRQPEETPQDSRQLQAAGGDQPEGPSPKAPYYPMKHHPRGFCVLISMNKNREGNPKDVQTMKELFGDKLLFTVVEYTDLAAEEIIKTLKEICGRSVLQNHDCISIVLMAHGNKGHIQGADNQCVELKSLYKIFYSSQCPHLRGKPKLFFIQACRGKLKDSGCEESDTMENNFADLQIDDAIPEHVDIEIAYSTVEDYVSWRHPNTGSWFMQTIDGVFREKADTWHLTDMLQEVRNRVAKEAAQKPRYKQTTETIDKLRGPLFFFPENL